MRANGKQPCSANITNCGVCIVPQGLVLRLGEIGSALAQRCVAGVNIVFIYAFNALQSSGFTKQFSMPNCAIRDTFTIPFNFIKRFDELSMVDESYSE